MTAEQRNRLEELLEAIRLRHRPHDTPGRILREAQTHDDVVEALQLVRDRGSP